MSSASEVFNSIGRNISSTADKVAKKTDQFISVQKVKSRQSRLEGQISEDLKAIGKLVYGDYKNGISLAPDIAEICDDIRDKVDQVKECKNEIAEMKGAIECPECGEMLPGGSKFCMHCGAAMAAENPDKDIFAETEDVEENDVDTRGAADEADN